MLNVAFSWRLKHSFPVSSDNTRSSQTRSIVGKEYFRISSWALEPLLTASGVLCVDTTHFCFAQKKKKKKSWLDKYYSTIGRLRNTMRSPVDPQYVVPGEFVAIKACVHQDLIWLACLMTGGGGKKMRVDGFRCASFFMSLSHCACHPIMCSMSFSVDYS